jgi:hypothetical protein
MKVMFFSPHAYYAGHALPESLVAEALENRGHNITYITCNGIYKKYCLCMSSLSSLDTDEKKEFICTQCKKNRNEILDEFRFKSIQLDSYISSEDIRYTEEIISNLDSKNYLTFELDKIPIARYALYEFLLNRKINTTDLGEEEWTEFKIYLRNALITCLAGRKIFQEESPDRIVVYNALYGTNHIMCSLAEQRNIPFYSLHAGFNIKHRLSELLIYNKLCPIINRNKSWPYFLNQPISAASIHRASEHISELLEANSPWVYSIKSGALSENSLRQFFGIQKNQKVLLATMSSADERYAAMLVDGIEPYTTPLFVTQIEWINFLIEFVKSKPELFLIIRVHPREFPNKRESVLSKQGKLLQNAFENLPVNAKVNFPSDSISLHDLLKITDVGLNSTSSSGLELLIFGIPVVIYDKGQFFSYGIELNSCGQTIIDYEKQIMSALDRGWSLDNVIGAYRWLSYVSERVSVDIADGYKGATSLSQNLIARGQRKIIRILGLEDNSIVKAVKRRKKPMKNNDLLAVAIEKGLESHLDDLSFKIENDASLESEKTLIKHQLIKFAEVIAAKGEDEVFMYKIRVICT